MELDELKLAWQTLDRHLETQNAISLQLFKQNRFDRVRAGLWPMRLSQIARILGGALLLTLVVPIWVANWQSPVVLMSGLAMHVYAVALCITGARSLWLLGDVDYAAPVLNIQQQLAHLRAFHLRSSFWLGNAWWLLWAPAGLLIAAWTAPPWFPVEAFDRAAPFVALNVGFGTVAVVVVVWLYTLLRRKNPDAVRRFEDRSSRSIANARKALDEIAQFEKA